MTINNYVSYQLVNNFEYKDVHQNNNNQKWKTDKFILKLNNDQVGNMSV